MTRNTLSKPFMLRTTNASIDLSLDCMGFSVERHGGQDCGGCGGGGGGGGEDLEIWKEATLSKRAAATSRDVTTAWIERRSEVT